MYKKYIIVLDHPLANNKGRVKESRFVLFNKLSGMPGNCHWCQIPLTWKTLCADHLDSNIMNNTEENLVGSCRGCNANREDGTGRGRKQPKQCKLCGISFIAKHHHNTHVYCSNKCASKDRPKRIKKDLKHGTRSRYMTGCRCKSCVYSNSHYWSVWNKKKVLAIQNR